MDVEPSVVMSNDGGETWSIIDEMPQKMRFLVACSGYVFFFRQSDDGKYGDVQDQPGSLCLGQIVSNHAHYDFPAEVVKMHCDQQIRYMFGILTEP